MNEKPEVEVSWLNENARAFLARGYLKEGQSGEDRLWEIATTAEKYLGRPGFAKKIYGYMAKGYISFATPVWTNFGNDKGLPISCYGSYVPDNMPGILFTQAEVGMMSKFGGGMSGYFGDIRPRGEAIKDNGHTSGSVHFMQLFDTLVNVVSQGAVRRGRFAPYLPVDHKDIEEFLEIGTEGNQIQNLTYGVTVTNSWLEEMKAGDEDKRRIWAKVIQRRGEIGYPYIMYTDNANEGTVDVYKDKEHKILASNLCSEIMLPSNERWSFVCCLSSLNLLYYDEWKDTDLVETMISFLDAVMSDFIAKLEAMRDSTDETDRQAFEFLKRAYTFAKENRALGMGVLGWHSYLQSKTLAFDSLEAFKANFSIFKDIREKALSASQKLAKEFGEPELLKGYGRRNTTQIAIAPTTSSAFILGQVSQGIEPIWSNCYVKDVEKIKVTIKNPFLMALIKEKGMDTKETWDSIRDHDGSVQHLDFLSDNEKAVFRTFAEIDQAVIIDQAGIRQEFIDQGQSLNLAIHPDTPAKELNQLYLMAAEKGVKALYYQHSVNAAQQLSREKICRACEG